MKEKTVAQKQDRKRRTSFLFKLTSRAIIFTTLLSFTILVMYLAGNFQRFLDSSQRYLLQCCSISCLLQGILCVIGIVMNLVMFFVSHHGKYWAYVAVDLLLLVLAVAGFILMYVVAFLSAGV